MTNPAYDDLTWLISDQVVILTNRTRSNFILDLPSGTYRLDAGRKMRTLRSILRIQQVQDLVRAGDIAVEDV